MNDDEFSWDDDKAEKNLKKHKLSFQLVRTIFADDDRWEDFDSDSSWNEDRFFCIGAIDFNVYYVTYTVLDDYRPHIISVRPASKPEINGYYRRKTAR
jgi:uncharacterized protein